MGRVEEQLTPPCEFALLRWLIETYACFIDKKKKILKIDAHALKSQWLSDYGSLRCTKAFNERQIGQLSL